MANKKKYRIYCNTEASNVFGYSNLDDPPSTCPNNPAHSVNADSKTVVESEAKDNLEATIDPTVNDDINSGYAIGSNWINTVSKISFKCVDNSAGAAVWSMAVVNWQSADSNDESSTTSTSWQDKVTMTTPALTGTFFMIYSAEIKSGDILNKAKLRCRNTTDNVTLANSNSGETDYESFSASSVVVFAGSSKTFKLQLQSKLEGMTSYVQNARMRLWRVA
jgi:hypothetical protein